MMRFVLRHRYMDVVIVLAVMVGGGWVVHLLTGSEPFRLGWIMVAAGVYTPIVHYLDRRRRREWRELGIPDPVLRDKPGGPIVNDYPVTPAARRRGRIYLALLLVTAAVVALLGLLEPGPWAGVAAALVMMAGALAGFVVFALGFRADD